MSHDQCPSTRGEERPAGGRDRPDVWRSPEELADTPGFREFLEREFPAGASELDGASRREFVKLMGAGLALAGAATIPACRRPDVKILAYSREVPEEITPGEPLYYATSMPTPGGGAEGLLVRTETGRPIKVEGNPLHPSNRGKSSTWAQASILGLYDPDRLKFPRYVNPHRGLLDATWDDFNAWATDHFARFDSDGGSRLAFIVDKKTSPTRDRVRDEMLKRWPRATWLPYEPMDDGAAIAGSRLAFGSPMRELLSLDKARVIVSLDRNVLHGERGALNHASGFAAGRRPVRAGEEMNRLYVVEPGVSETGASADHRLRLAPSRITAFAAALGRAVLERTGGGGKLGEALDALHVPGRDEFRLGEADLVAAIADDLVAHRGEGVVLVGSSQPAEVHALGHALNAVLGNAGAVVSYLPMGDDEAADSLGQLRDLSARMAAGEIDTLVCMNVNPVYDAPADFEFAPRFAKVPNTITLSVGDTETVWGSTWRLNGAHYLESWSDTESLDGTIAPTQPMIAPLYGRAHSDAELIALIAGLDTHEGYELVRATWQGITRLKDERFEKLWRRSLHDGVLANSTPTPAVPDADPRAVAGAVSKLSLAAAPSENALDVVFATSHVHDGRFANYSWLQELPHAGSRVVWDNPVLLSPATAKALKLEPPEGSEDPYTAHQLPRARMGELNVGGRRITMPVWIMPGMADGCAIVHVGYGREHCGYVGTGIGFNSYSVRASDGAHTASGATLARAHGSYEIVSTQDHWSMEGRNSIVRRIDKAAWDEHGDKSPEELRDLIYAALPGHEVNLAEQLGELSHSPAPVSIYVNPLNRSTGDPNPGDEAYDTALKKDLPPAFARGPQWGMSIDLSACTGCGGCTIACQAENNIPVVGKREVAKGREMHWIRVDRYYTGDDLNDPGEVLHQPVPCMQCENAPCETVCPVNATSHGEYGTNDMVYNRCIGTRYCANNCPYKVRRFNFFDFSQTKFNGTFVGEGSLGRPRNVNFIPPRLRQKLDEIQKMRMNPDVTIRGRGVMEKCTYCIQRVNRARADIRVRDEMKSLPGIPDGMVETACQQACPSGAIEFGDLLDESSVVRSSRVNNRSYMLLGFLATRPRTTYMLRVRNPNPAVRASEDPFVAHTEGGENGADETGQSEARALFHRTTAPDGGARIALRVIGAEA